MPTLGLLGEPSELTVPGLATTGFGRFEGVADAVGGEADRVLSAEWAVLAEGLAWHRLQHARVGVGFDQHVVGHRAAVR